MKLITFEDIVKLNISPKKCYEWVEETIANKELAILPPKISMKPMPGVFCNVMPSIISQRSGSWGGVKVVTRYPERKPALDSDILLMDASTGEFLAVMDGNWITTMRTGAVAAHSIVTLAKDGFSTIGIIGLGNVSRATLLVLSDLFPQRQFIIKLLKYKGQEESFCSRFSQFTNFCFEFFDSYDSVVKDSDVVISGVTYAPDDFCADDVYEPGVLVVPIHTLGFTNCDLFFDKVFGDDYGHICGFKNFNQFKSFAEMTDVVNGNKPGRETNSERILAYNVGVSTHDLCFASYIYEALKGNNELLNFDMKGPVEKFWI